jgi:hypothetical protein
MTPTSRERFEAFMRANSEASLSRYVTVARVGERGLGDYVSRSVQLAWLAWQEAERGKAECVEVLDELANVAPLLNSAEFLISQNNARRLLAQLKGQP